VATILNFVPLTSLFVSREDFCDAFCIAGVPLDTPASNGHSKFLPARRYASSVFATATCPSVRLDICPLHAGIVPSRAKAGS